MMANAAPAGAAAHVVVAVGLEVVVPLAGMIDLDKEAARVSAELENLAKQIVALDGRLSNEKFTAKAPAAIVDAERAKLVEWKAKRDQLAAKLRSFSA